MNDETEYSTPCNPVNMVANIIVYNKPYKALPLFPLIKKWCPYVTVNPEASRITVLIKGSSKGSIASIPRGGHIAPNSTAGDKALVYIKTISSFPYFWYKNINYYKKLVKYMVSFYYING